MDLHQKGDKSKPHQLGSDLMSETHNYGDCPATQSAASCPNRKVVLITVHEITLCRHHCYYLGIIEILMGYLPVPSEVHWYASIVEKLLRGSITWPELLQTYFADGVAFLIAPTLNAFPMCVLEAATAGAGCLHAGVPILLLANPALHHLTR